jgi:hypothetical protein
MGSGNRWPRNGISYFIAGVLCIVVAVGSFVAFGGHFSPAADERAQNAKVDLPRVDVQKKP